ncbi:MAG: PepSY-associated TM helix domain-containing protein [Burkholderiaceae bacterium]
MPKLASAIPAVAKAKRSGWLRTLHQWHWISSALCLLGMLLFSVTGITLNHASQIEAKPAVTQHKASVPPNLQAELERYAEAHDGKEAPMPASVQAWLEQSLPVKIGTRDAEWSSEEMYLALPRPGGDAWLRIELPSGEAEYEVTDRGWISWLNDLHKGRHTGVAWSWFIDIFAAACLVFSLTGLLILKFHAANRPFTWPMVGMGVLVPALLALLFIH